MQILLYFVNFFLLQALIILTFGVLTVNAALTVEDCQKCHEHEYQQIATRGVAHKEKVTCLNCHENHRPRLMNNIPECINCHDEAPHKAIVDCSGCHKRTKNCKACHDVHQPRAWTDEETALLHCKTCHPSAFELLKNNTSQHHDLNCGYCHTEHRSVQSCRDCHGRPHPEGTHKLFPQCVTCHNVAHDLNRM